MKNIKYILKAVVIIGIVFAFVAPGAAMLAKNKTVTIEKQTNFPLIKIFSRNPGWVEQASNFWEPSQGIHYMHAVDENIVWAVGYDGSGAEQPAQEFTRTTNGGTLWEAKAIIGAPIDGDTAMIFALDADHAWVPIHSGTPQGIWYISDGGVTWTHQDTADFNGSKAFPNVVHFWNENDGWCMGDPVDGYFEMYTSSNGGATWTRVPSENIPEPFIGEMGTVGYYDSVGDTVWFGSQGAGRVFKSTDKGLHWTAAETPCPSGAYIDVRFKDALNGIAIDKNFGDAWLAETSDGGETWTEISYTGKCHGADLDYVPGTYNMYVSTGVQSGAPENNGASYSLDGGHSWTLWTEVEGVQLFGTTWVNGRIGWAGNFNADDVTGGVYKYTPDENQPPTAPVINGQTNGTVGKKYDYGFTSYDFEDDDIKEYIVNWGDGTGDETITGPFTAGEKVTGSHTWNKKGDYVITAKAKDINDLIGPEGTFTINMPKNKAIYRPFLQFLEEIHTNLFPILRYILGL